MGADAGQGARVLHGLRPRRPDLAESRLPRPAGAGHPLGGEQGAGPRQPGAGAGRAAAVHLRRGVGRDPQLPARPAVGHAGRADPPHAAPALARGIDAAHGRAARVRTATVRRRARDRQAHLHDLGPPRPPLDRRERRLPEYQAPRHVRPRPDHGLRGHRRRRQGRQVHRLRRGAQHPHEPPLRRWRRDRAPGARIRCSSRTPTATARPMSARSCSPAGAPTTPTPGRATCAGGSTTGSGGSSATRASAAPWAASGSAPGRRSTASSPTARSSSSSATPTTTRGASASARTAWSSARRPTAARASTCRSPTAITRRCAAGRRRCCRTSR